MAALANFAGASVLSLTAWQRQLATAQFIGAGNILAVPTIVGAVYAWAANASFIRASGLSVTAVRLVPTVAKFVVASTLLVDASQFRWAIANFVGASALAADAKRVTYAVANFAGISAFAGNAARFLPAVARFTGDSDLLAKLALAGTNDAEAVFHVSSAMRIASTLIRNPNVKVLAGSVGNTKALRGNVVYDEGLLGDVQQKRQLRAG
jgi:hypothetical protein